MYGAVHLPATTAVPYTVQCESTGSPATMYTTVVCCWLRVHSVSWCTLAAPPPSAASYATPRSAVTPTPKPPHTSAGSQPTAWMTTLFRLPSPTKVTSRVIRTLSRYTPGRTSTNFSPSIVEAFEIAELRLE
uniref:Uncharacterized protein n=1 Tax=Chrysotila carterae TaxID=13221 RepID=A0A6S9QNE9_CHRCT